MTTRHHEIDEWADFARGLLDEAVSAAMRRHLGEGCRRCARRLEAVRWLADLARAEAESPLPPADLRMARSIAGLAAAAGAGETEPREVRLTRLFDSEGAAAPAAVRRQTAAERQLVFEAPDYTLYLRLEPAPGGVGCAVAGQLFDREGAPVAGVPACFLVADAEPRYSTTGDDGDFELAAEGAGEGELRFLVGDELRLTVELRA